MNTNEVKKGNPLGDGTKNMSVCVLDAEHEAYGKLACKKGISRNKLVRRALSALLLIEDPEEWRRIEMVRKARAGLVIFVAGLAVAWVSISGTSRIERGRARTSRPTVRVIASRKILFA